MSNFGFVRVAAAVSKVRVAEPSFNKDQILTLIKQAHRQGVRVVVFPELSLTAYTCGDLFLKPLLIKQAEQALAKLLVQTRTLDIIFIVGMPVREGSSLLNSAVVCYKGRILGIIPKTYLPNYKEFYEKRWFTSALVYNKTELSLCGQTVAVGTDLLFQAGGCTFGVEICEDLWTVISPSSKAVLAGADVIFNLSASNALTGKHNYVEQLENSAEYLGSEMADEEGNRSYRVKLHHKRIARLTEEEKKALLETIEDMAFQVAGCGFEISLL